LKKCKKEDDVLFINASEQFDKGKRQNSLDEKHIDNIVDTYKFRQESERYSRRVTAEEIEKNGYNLNISRYISTAEPEPIINLVDINQKLVEIEKNIQDKTNEHNSYLKELKLKEI
jgi:type I restriction enzyme M protein